MAEFTKQYIKQFGLLLPIIEWLLNNTKKIFKGRVRQILYKYKHQIIENKILRFTSLDLINRQNKQNNIQASRTKTNTENIWVLWLQGEDNMPDIVKLCVASIRKHSGGHPVIILDEKTLFDYISLPEHIIRKYTNEQITRTHFSDIIRFKLLYEYGGFWIDSTILLTDDLDSCCFNAPIFSHKLPPSKGYFVSEFRWAGNFMSLRNKSDLANIANEIINKYWDKYDTLIDYFLIDYIIDIAYKNNPAIKKNIDSIPISNPLTHELLPLLTDRFDKKVFDDISSNTSVFKLNWKKYSAEQLNENSQNFYCYLKNKIFNSNE